MPGLGDQLIVFQSGVDREIVRLVLEINFTISEPATALIDGMPWRALLHPRCL
jgi:hypothetical protein